ncbi:MAG: Sb-PDE family phosphodiesterase [Bacteroidetes bacterium]|nr:Sb-PDE family phosphodiesterase [Bacteroidota bacterium]
MKYSLLFACFFISSLSFSQEDKRKIEFPDVEGYQTVIVDLHMHTVFSDGSVWPDIRVFEAVKDGIDLIAITEHLEYQPHAADIPHPNRNRSFDLASRIAAQEKLMVVNGSEITRSMPPGHGNAVFIQDANKLLIDDPIEAYREANRQGAFTFWNHPNWTAHFKDGIAKLTDMHRQLISEGLLHGIEVVNDHTFSDEALQIALDNNLTILGTSDIHGLVDWQYEIPLGNHRPVTLVFANEKSEEGVKKALMEGRTSVWFKNMLVGREEYLIPLINSSIVIKSANYSENHTVLPVVITNNTGVKFILENLSNYTLHADSDIIEINPNGETTLEVKTINKTEHFSMNFRVLNAITAPKTHPEITLNIKPE